MRSSQSGKWQPIASFTMIYGGGGWFKLRVHAPQSRAQQFEHTALSGWSNNLVSSLVPSKWNEVLRPILSHDHRLLVVVGWAPPSAVNELLTGCLCSGANKEGRLGSVHEMDILLSFDSPTQALLLHYYILNLSRSRAEYGSR